MAGHVEGSVTHLESKRGERVTSKALGDTTSRSELDGNASLTTTVTEREDGRGGPLQGRQWDTTGLGGTGLGVSQVQCEMTRRDPSGEVK